MSLPFLPPGFLQRFRPGPVHTAARSSADVTREQVRSPGPYLAAGAVDLPHGVPSPDHAHVHPYPTRYHGGIWTRPVFGFPWNRSPYAVFRPSQMNGLGAPYIDPTFRPYHGVGQLWDTGTGVFRRPSYDGGGIFNDVSGLGAIPSEAVTFFGAAAVTFAVTAFLLRR